MTLQAAAVGVDPLHWLEECLGPPNSDSLAMPSITPICTTITVYHLDISEPYVVGEHMLLDGSTVPRVCGGFRIQDDIAA